jgi:hypothetical protein
MPFSRKASRWQWVKGTYLDKTLPFFASREGILANHLPPSQPVSSRARARTRRAWTLTAGWSRRTSGPTLTRTRRLRLSLRTRRVCSAAFLSPFSSLLTSHRPG